MRVSVFLFAVSLASMSASSCVATPLTCHVDINSTKGGRIELIRIDRKPNIPVGIPLQLSWHPPASQNVLDLAIGYNGNELNQLDDPSGGHLLFAPSAGVDKDNYMVRVSAAPNESWSFGSEDIAVGAYQDGIGFDKGDTRGRGILAAIRDRKSIKVDIISNGKVGTTVTFDTSKTKGRDVLVKKALHMIAISDPNVCKPIDTLPVSFPPETGKAQN